MKRDTERKITVEDLIRLKRAERPPAEFWANFEAEIRAKQLSAIVGRRPWWSGLSRAFAIVNRHQLSIGSAAAVALAFAGYRYVGAHGEPVPAPRVVAAKPALASFSHASAASVASTNPAPVAPRVVQASAPQEEAEVVSEDSAPAPRPVVTATASHITQAPAAASVADGATRAPFADGIAITLADFRETPSDYTKAPVFGSDREFETSIAPARQPPSEDPLANMDPAAERRARLLSPALGSARAVASDWIRQRAASEDRMYESMDRGSNDDRMLVGFRF